MTRSFVRSDGSNVEDVLKEARALYNNGDWITLEEYYGIDSEYSRKTR